MLLGQRGRRRLEGLVSRSFGVHDGWSVAKATLRAGVSVEDISVQGYMHRGNFGEGTVSLEATGMPTLLKDAPKHAQKDKSLLDKVDKALGLAKRKQRSGGIVYKPPWSIGPAGPMDEEGRRWHLVA